MESDHYKIEVEELDIKQESDSDADDPLRVVSGNDPLEVEELDIKQESDNDSVDQYDDNGEDKENNSTPTIPKYYIRNNKRVYITRSDRALLKKFMNMKKRFSKVSNVRYHLIAARKLVQNPKLVKAMERFADIPEIMRLFGDPDRPKTSSSDDDESDAERGFNYEDVLKKPPASKIKKRVRITKEERELIQKLITLKRKFSNIKVYNGRQSLINIYEARKLLKNKLLVKSFDKFSKIPKFMNILKRTHLYEDEEYTFTMQEKVIAFAIYIHNSEFYTFIRNVLPLPSLESFRYILERYTTKPGIDSKVFKHLKTKAMTMVYRREKFCTLMFEEILVTPYMLNKKIVKDLSEYCQVFKIKGLLTKYEQTLCYTIRVGTTKGEVLAEQIRDIITKLKKAGYIVINTLCDQSLNNQSAIEHLIERSKQELAKNGEELKENVFYVNNQIVIPLYDLIHLQKDIRNHLRMNNVVFEMDGVKRIAMWHDLELLHKKSLSSGILVPELKDSHLSVKKINKINAEFASTVFCERVQWYMMLGAKFNDEAVGTAYFVHNLYKSFDDVNTICTPKCIEGKRIRISVKKMILRKKNWKEMKNVVKSMRVVDSNGKEEFVSAFQNWLWTMEGCEVLLKTLSVKYGI